MMIDRELGWMIAAVIGVLVAASIATAVLSQRLTGERHRDLIDNLVARVKAWWAMIIIFGVSILTGGTGTVILFALLSFFALREFITLSPTTRGDHRVLIWIFYIITPLQYYFIWDEWYGMYTILIPVYAFLLLPARSALVGQTEQFLQRTAITQWALMICVYCLSMAPAILTLTVKGDDAGPAKLLLFLVIVVQGSDVLQYVWGKLRGRHKISPRVSPNKTWEGFIGGIASATVIGMGLWWATPFNPWQAALMALIACIMGFFGGLVMSSIKRDRGIKDFGHAIAGHGGILDRVDSLIFAAPIFFHLARFYFDLA